MDAITQGELHFHAVVRGHCTARFWVGSQPLPSQLSAPNNQAEKLLSSLMQIQGNVNRMSACALNPPEIEHAG